MCAMNEIAIREEKSKSRFIARQNWNMAFCSFCWRLQLHLVVPYRLHVHWKGRGYCNKNSTISNVPTTTTTKTARRVQTHIGNHSFNLFYTKACFTNLSHTSHTTKSSESKDNQPLESLPYYPYLDERGFLTFQDDWGKVSVYAIYDAKYRLQYIGISRDTRTSLLLHLIRMPALCYYFKFQSFSKPSRTILNQVRETWIKEMSDCPPIGNSDATLQERWEGPIDIRRHGWLTTEEQQSIQETDENNLPKILKQICRRVQKEIEKQLAERNVQEVIRFDPKLKEKGLLDGQSKKVDVPDTI